jgi:dimethylamine/trimethylamine dehydrogenase
MAAAADVLAVQPDAVIVATGAEFSRTGRSGMIDRDLPGAELPHVFTPEDVLGGRARPSGKVLIMDGEGTHASSGLAEMLGAGGAQVTMVSSNYAPYSNRSLYAFEGAAMARRMAAAGVAFHPATWVKEIAEGSATLYEVNGRREWNIAADAVVLATGRLSQDGLAAELEGKVGQLFLIGDALGVRPWATATYEGHKFARLIGESDAPRTTGEAFFRSDSPEVYPVAAG